MCRRGGKDLSGGGFIFLRREPLRWCLESRSLGGTLLKASCSFVFSLVDSGLGYISLGMQDEVGMLIVVV